MKFCVHCGKEIVDEAVICLNCGCKVKTSMNTSCLQPQQILVEDSESQLAVASKICGIVSFFVGWFVLGITAIVLACISRDDTNGIMCPSAKVGLTCGIISTALSLLLMVIFIAAMVSITL